MSRAVGPSAEGKFALRFNTFNRVLMTVLLCGPRTCRVELSAEHLRVSMGVGGWAFSASIPRSSLSLATRYNGPVLGWGAHGWRGQWLVNGSSSGLVRIPIDPRARGRCLGYPLRLKVLLLSLEEPDEFIAALAGAPTASG